MLSRHMGSWWDELERLVPRRPAEWRIDQAECTHARCALYKATSHPELRGAIRKFRRHACRYTRLHVNHHRSTRFHVNVGTYSGLPRGSIEPQPHQGAWGVGAYRADVMGGWPPPLFEAGQLRIDLLHANEIRTFNGYKRLCDAASALLPTA